jgi:hypothetical protein
VITFGDLKFGAVGRSSGMDVTGPDFLNYCNDSVRQLMNRGNWWATVAPITACVRDRVITWPRQVATILGMNTSTGPNILDNRWFKFMMPDSRYRNWVNDYARSGWWGNIHTVSSSTSPVFNQIRAEGFNIRVNITNKADVGKTITFYGTDVNGQPVITTRADGTIQHGEQVVLALPHVDTQTVFRYVLRVVKDVTSGDLLCYQHNIAADFVLDLARYQPTETAPDYIVTHTSGYNCDAGCSKEIEALVKMKFVPFQFDGDLVQIDTEDAIRDMLIAVRKKEAGDIAGSLAYETSGIRELNYQMKNRFPDEQFIVNFRPFGRDGLNNYETRISMI